MRAIAVGRVDAKGSKRARPEQQCRVRIITRTELKPIITSRPCFRDCIGNEDLDVGASRGSDAARHVLLTAGGGGAIRELWYDVKHRLIDVRVKVIRDVELDGITDGTSSRILVDMDNGCAADSLRFGRKSETSARTWEIVASRAHVVVDSDV